MATKTWIVYKAQSLSAHGWKERMLIPSGGLTEILREAWNYSGKMPQAGDRVTEFHNGHYRQGDWVVTSVNHFSSPDIEEQIVVCYCEYSPIESPWMEAKRGKPVDEMLKAVEISR